MKGDERVVKKLDELLSDELTAIDQYMVHSESSWIRSHNWGCRCIYPRRPASSPWLRKIATIYPAFPR
jgi:bacterioferritin (cytochrome b1)